MRLALKGILLYTTILYTILLTMVADSIIDDYFILAAIINLLLFFACYRLISEEEFKVLTFYNILN